MQIPFVRLLQPMSPQINKRNAEYIKGAEQGDAFNTVTGEYWPGEEGIKVIPCYQTTEYLEFVPRDLGGGFKGRVPIGDPLINQTKREGSKEILPNGNELVKSDQHYCLVLDDEGSYQPAIIDMKSSGLKISRQWKSKISMQRLSTQRQGRLRNLLCLLRSGGCVRLRKPTIKALGITGPPIMSVWLRTVPS